MRRLLLALIVVTACGGDGAPTQVDYSGPVADWPHYGRDLGGLRYSPLDQIHTRNVEQLEVAWTYHHGDVSDGTGEVTRTSFQATPIMVEGTLYFCTGFNRVIALDAETGEERWAFDPELRGKRLSGPYPLTCRGVEYWRDPEAPPDAHCSRRIFTGTIDSELIALDAGSGEPCAGFGEGGRVQLREGIGEAAPWEYYPTSPPLPIRDVVVIGALVADNLRADAPSGVVRGFDARTGALRWAWDPVPPGWSGESGSNYTAGTPNVWAPLSGDEARGLVFVPTGNAAPDYYGGARHGLDKYSSSTVALDVETGAVVWHFQTVHQDVWDYDVASQPAVFDFPGESGQPAIVQPTKMGHVFVLHRETGKPLFPVEERPVPRGDVPGESLSPTQPFPTHPAPLIDPTLTPERAWGFTFYDRGKCRDLIASYRSEGIFTPPSSEGTIQFPGSAGGANWGGAAIDPEGVLYVNMSHLPQVVSLVPREEYEALPSKEAVYPNELYPMAGTPYAVRRGPLFSPFGAMCNPPPWGTLTAVDLVSGEKRWEVTLGTTRDQAPWPMWLPLGSPNLGGLVVTGGGLIFIGATTDKFVRAFDTATGEEVWRQRIPFTANSTPMTYRLRSDGKQYVVVPAGGHGWSEPGDAVIAFALPGP